MKNWIRFASGVWVNSKNWEDRGIVYVDPTGIALVSEVYGAPSGSCIHTGGIFITVREAPGDVIAQIQSALP
jgi:hypothetical protein